MTAVIWESALATTMELNFIDLGVIGLYLLTLPVIGLWVGRRQSQTADFLLAGRRLTLPLFVGTLVCTWYGGIFGIAEMVSWYGLGTWLIQGFFWYLVYALFAFFLAGRIRQTAHYTIPDQLEAHYGRWAAACGGVFTYSLTSPAPYLLSLTTVLFLLMDLSLPTALFLAALLTIVHILFSGLRGVAYTDFVQFLLIYLAFGLLFGFTVARFGGFSFLEQHLTPVKGYEKHLTWTGGMSWPYIFSWGGIALSTLVDPNFYQRCYAAVTPRVAQWGVLLSIIFWFVFDFLSISTALYALAAHNASIIHLSSARTAYLALADFLLPSPWRGLFVVGLFALILSSADSFALTSGINISRDFYWRLYNRQASDRQMVRAATVGIFFSVALAAWLAWLCPSIVELWYILGTIGVSALLVPMLVSFTSWPKVSLAAILSQLAGGLTSTIWFTCGYWQSEGLQYPLALPPLYPGLLMALLTFGLVQLIKRKTGSSKE